MEPIHARGQAATALGVLQKVIDAVGQGRPADKTLAEIFRTERKFGSRDRRFISALVFSYFRWLGWLKDLELPRAAALAYALDAVEPHNAQTALAGELLPSWGDLSLGEKRDALAGYIGVALDLSLLVPDWLQNEVESENQDKLIESFQTRPQTWIRARANMADSLIEAMTELKANPVLDSRELGAIACKGGTDLAELRRQVGPCFEVQDIASQAVGRVCGARAGERWWDVCAGAGGKALHLADMMQDKGEIIASDVRRSALRELEKRAHSAGFSVIRSRNAAAKPAGKFDGVLVDAPCSGIGTWARNADMRWRTNPAEIAEKSSLQLKLVNEAATQVRTGGRLVYSVCTMTTSETSEVIRSFLDSNPDFEPDPFQRWSSDSSHLWCIWPWEGPGGGMFIARFRRRG